MYHLTKCITYGQTTQLFQMLSRQFDVKWYVCVQVYFHLGLCVIGHKHGYKWMNREIFKLLKLGVSEHIPHNV